MTQAKPTPAISDLAAGLSLDDLDGAGESKGRDIFQRISNFDLADQARAAGLYPFFKPIEVNEGTEAVVDGKRVLMLGSNNYLGLTRHPEVMRAAQEALAKHGPSMTGSRLLNGTTPLHEELEEQIAEFLGVESAIVFSTGYLANLGAISALVDRGCWAIIDKGVHASIYDGVAMAAGQSRRFRHDDMAHLEEVLRRIPDQAPRIVITDGVHSMTGGVAPLPELMEVCRRQETRLLVDDAHAIGTLGETGRGTASHFGLEAARLDDRNVQQVPRVRRGIHGGAAGRHGVREALRAADDFHRRAAPGVGGRGLGGAEADRRGAVAGTAGAGDRGAHAPRSAGAGVRSER